MFNLIILLNISGFIYLNWKFTKKIRVLEALIKINKITKEALDEHLCKTFAGLVKSFTFPLDNIRERLENAEDRLQFLMLENGK